MNINEHHQASRGGRPRGARRGRSDPGTALRSRRGPGRRRQRPDGVVRRGLDIDDQVALRKDAMYRAWAQGRR